MLLDTIEVFKTDICSASQGSAVVLALQQHFPTLKVHLDLDDCDRVMRVESKSGTEFIAWERVREFVQRLGIAIEVLSD
jgi:hypothetical protein